ncbi:Lrp/AsnC ligand binding domain-containing protein [Candidatus Nitrosotalea okcheonensis]|uniref:Transcriptional regulator, AsnC family (Modular protein) n=1 Tax=Candidatus Nitrosotalea okcheonensis TaxID=1903276 RepID=A0A2H1FFG5_9ARCH|nr:Lrp/AsnC ligand binding domain-containing protein [Candidatus Nitrosotalea okcheonensis]SMH71519.1 Transcriptional regulator, AsnC family (modular protein) [Candidatus Nitrosotalea okcheonensis]
MSFKYNDYKDKDLQETFVLINCHLGKEQQIVKSLQKLHGVKEVQATHGVYDVIVKIQTMTERELNETVRSKILGLGPVTSILMLQSE